MAVAIAVAVTMVAAATYPMIIDFCAEGLADWQIRQGQWSVRDGQAVAEGGFGQMLRQEMSPQNFCIQADVA